jgi:hypothetical protein
MLDVREYQLIQEENTRFRILVEPLPGRSIDRILVEKVMLKQLRDYGLHEQLTITVETVERLTNDGEQKFKRVVCEAKKLNGDPRHPTNAAGKVADKKSGRVLSAPQNTRGAPHQR